MRTARPDDGQVGEIARVAKAVADTSGIRNGRPVYDRDDAEQDAAIGALSAARRYDPDSAASFSTFIQRRARGEVQDGLRRLDHLTRGQRHNGCDDRPPLSLDHPAPDSDPEGDPLSETVEDPSATTEDKALAASSAAELDRHLAMLPGPQQYAVRGRYLLGLTGPEMAEHLGVTPARISQLVKAGLARLRVTLNHIGEFDGEMG
jgi:RNA polymerase sigma factor (sigma-70 family)